MRCAQRCWWGVGLLCLVALSLLGVRYWPKPPLRDRISTSTAYYAAGGELLRLTLAPDQQYRLWEPLERMPARLPEAVLLYEDRWFYWHPGINPVALVRAGLSTYAEGERQGASTLTMQLARRLYGLHTRSASGKLMQMVAALWLELRYSKREILEAYLNVAPYGRNVEGVGAASLALFQRPIERLSTSQMLTLAVIPQNPRARSPLGRGDFSTAGPLYRARARLWARWIERKPEEARYRADVESAGAVSAAAMRLPFRAPHWVDWLAAQGASGHVHTTLDVRRQAVLENAVQSWVSERGSVGIQNASALLVNGQTGAIEAYVGSANYFDRQIDGQVGALGAKRSPGSTLKPFIYALGIDQGLLHANTVLKDASTAFGPFSPENFDGHFVGPITAQEALIRSRNVPAVAVASQLSRPSLYDFLKQAGVSQLDTEQHYGLALALGGAEVTMEELASLYVMLARRGRWHALHGILGKGQPDESGPRLLSEEASFIAIDMLQSNPRPDSARPAVPAVAWKTGTSWGFRDAWTAGLFGRYVLVVWVGNFNGQGNPAFVGVHAAAPLFFRIVDRLRSQGLDGGVVAHAAPAQLEKVEVCAASGELPNAYCPHTVPTWFIPGKSPIRVSTLHQPVWIDTHTGQAACGPGPNTKQEIYEFWSADLQRLFQAAGMPRRSPPPLPDQCATSPETNEGPSIASPLRGVVYTLSRREPQPLFLRASTSPSAREVFWFADEAFLGKVASGQRLAWTPQRAGRYRLRAVDERGASTARELTVEFH